jgi:spermidine synthase
VGRGVGGIYGANTAGAIFGAFAAGFVLIPLFGSQKSLVLLAWINIFVGATVLVFAPGPRLVLRRWAMAAALIPVVLLSLAPPADLVVGLFARSMGDASMLYHDEGAGGTVTVFETAEGQRMLRVNGAGEVPTDHRSIQIFRLLGSLPLLLHDDPQEVLVIAFGGGITLASVELHQPRRTECVEVVPGVFEAARYFARYNRSVFERLDQGGMHAIVDDGRNYVRRTERSYDVIISDSTHPGTADSWVLYTEEFYRICRERLAEGGIMAQWLPLHGLTVSDYKTTLRTFREVFPHATLWLTPGYSVLLGTTAPLSIDLDRVETRLARKGVREFLSEVDLGDATSILATLALDENAMAAYAGAGPLNTDDHPRLGFSDRSRAGTQRGFPVLIDLMPFLDPRLGPGLVHATAADRRQLERRRLSRGHLFAAELALMMGQRERATAQLRRARALDPGEREASRLLSRLQAPGVGR